MLYGILTMLFVSLSSIATLHAEGPLYHTQDSSQMEEILANGDFCIEKISPMKVYLKADKITPTQKGIFIEISPNTYLSLPALQADSEGCYLSMNSDTRNGEFNPLPCPRCQKVFTPLPSNPKCPSCGYRYPGV